MQKKKIRQNVRLLLSQGDIFLIAAAGVILFADCTGHLLTDLAHQADIACLQQVLLAQLRRSEFCKNMSCSMPNLHIASRQKSMSSAKQQAEHGRNAARSRKSREQLCFCCRRYPGEQQGW